MTEMVEASQVWLLAEQKLPTAKLVNVVSEVQYVLRHLASHAPDLYCGKPAPSKSEQEIVQLARDLSYKVSEPIVQVRFNFLAIGFEIGNISYGWNVPLVPQLVSIKKPKNWATTDNFSRRVAASKLEQAFGKDLEQPISKDPSVHLGQLLFTAIFFGCLLEKKWLEPFLTAVMQRDFFQYNGILWVEMVRKTDSSMKTDDDLHPISTYYTKRFFPDNFTLVQLYHLLDSNLVPAAISNQNPWGLLQSFMKTLPGVSFDGLPGSLDEFLKLSISRNLMLPGSLLAYATGQLKSTSLAIGPWLRCVSQKAIMVLKPESAEQLTKTPVPKIVVPRRYNAKQQEKLVTKLLQLLHPKGKDLSKSGATNILENFFKDHKHEMSPAFQLMVHWGKQLLSNHLGALQAMLQ